MHNSSYILMEITRQISQKTLYECSRHFVKENKIIMHRFLSWKVPYRLLATYIMDTLIFAGGTIDEFTSLVKNHSLPLIMFAL